jgi:hypothetical protein
VTGFSEHGNEPSDSIKKAGYLLTSCVTTSFSNNILQHAVSKYIFFIFIYFSSAPHGA